MWPGREVLQWAGRRLLPADSANGRRGDHPSFGGPDQRAERPW